MVAPAILDLVSSFVRNHWGIVLMMLCSTWKLLVVMKLIEPTMTTEIASSIGVALGVFVSTRQSSRSATAKKVPSNAGRESLSNPSASAVAAARPGRDVVTGGGDSASKSKKGESSFIKRLGS